MIRIGTAGWSIPRRFAPLFRPSGSGLERYAARFNGAEINSTFYRSHRPQTYARWSAAVPEGFRFSVKLPKTITHERRLVDSADILDAFLDEVGQLGPCLGPLLIQLPPSLAFDLSVAQAFIRLLRSRTEGEVACEPRHPTWFEGEADRLLADFRVARVAADPAPVPQAAVPGGWPNVIYFRLHGSPRMYYSEYGEAFIADLAAQLRSGAAAEAWCIFDNTVSGAAIGNALDLADRLLRCD
jgi:uncharacterized protein YecE (DUF72 family)